MKKPVLTILAMTLLLAPGRLFAQGHDVSKGYVKPDDPAVLQNLEAWQDLKFGLFMHWGTYSQWGVVESWSLCPEDESWTQRDTARGATYYDYVKNYERLQSTFNPTRFDPAKWATAAKAAGMRYVVFTTKHHDGFAMFDTRQSDYKITSPNTPFSRSPKADATREIFTAFRQDGFKIGAYFSKPDWHCPDYWWPYFPPKDRNVNYDPVRYPERWNRYKDFTYNQIGELTSNYGKVDILWLDGGWVRPFASIDTSVSWQKTIRVEQDIDMDRIGAMARKNQPGLIVVDRTVPGRWENYVTPEQAVPDHALGVPWESCITMGESFSYVPNDRYKTTQQIVETLIKIISRGGNYLMNIAPGPTGDFDPIVYTRLTELAGWMKINQSAVYGTRAVAPYHSGDYYYTRSKDGKALNVFHLAGGKQQEYRAPESASFELPTGFTPGNVRVLGISGKVTWKQVGTMITVKLPVAVSALRHATVFQLSAL